MHASLLTNSVPFRRIVVVRALPGLGDMLCAVPALRALRAALPYAHITLLGLPIARFLVDRFAHYLDEWIEFPGFPGLEREPVVRHLPAFFAAMHARGFDLALQLHGSGGTSNPFTMLLGAHHTAGCFLPEHYCPDSATFLPYPDDRHEIWRSLQLMDFLGAPPRGDDLEFPLTTSDHNEYTGLRAVLANADLYSGAYVCLHPGSSTPERRWTPQQFAVVGDNLAARGLQVVLTGSTSERNLTSAVAAAMHHHTLDLAGQTSLGGLGALLGNARLLVCNDTGISHLAAALRVPSVVVFSASDPARWAPLDCRLHRAIDARSNASAERAVLASVEALLRSEGQRNAA